MTRPECQNLRDKLHGYRLGEGTPLERQKLELHLKKCAGCNITAWPDHAAHRGRKFLIHVW